MKVLIEYVERPPAGEPLVSRTSHPNGSLTLYGPRAKDGNLVYFGVLKRRAAYGVMA